MDDNDINLIFGRVLSNMTNKEKQLVESEGLHLVPTWKQASSINLKYLQTHFEAPIAGYVAEINTCRTDGKNCCISECNLPLRSVLCVGAKVMLLVNYTVGYNLTNGSFGVVQNFVLAHLRGKKEFEDSQIYVVVEFPKSKNPIREKNDSKQAKNLDSHSSFPMKL